MQMLVWSFKALASGKHPTTSFDGSAIPKDPPFYLEKGKWLAPGGLRCVIWSIQGDHEFFSNVLKLPHWNTARPCWERDACANPLPKGKCFRTIRPADQAFTMVYTAEAHWSPPSAHHLFSIPGVTSCLVRGDGSRVMFTNGIYAHLLGSILHYLCWKEGPGVRQRIQPCERLGVVFTNVQQYYREHQVATRLTNLKLSVFTKTDHPHQQRAFLNLRDLNANGWRLLCCKFARVCLMILTKWIRSAHSAGFRKHLQPG